MSEGQVSNLCCVGSLTVRRGTCLLADSLTCDDVYSASASAEGSFPWEQSYGF